MSKSELFKDLFLLCINNIGISVIHVWTVLYPYYSSYLHALDPSITASKIFATLICYYIGSLVGNILNPYFLQVIGYRNMMIYGGVLNLYWAYITSTQTSIFQILLGRGLMGYIKAVVWDSNNLFLSEKYANEGGVINIRIVHIFRYFFSSVVILVSQKYINPWGENAYSTPEGEKVFSSRVNQNFIEFIWILGMMNLVTIIIPVLFMEIPIRLQSNIFQFYKSIKKRKKFNSSLSHREISIMLQTSMASVRLNQDVSRSFHEISKDSL